MTIYNKNHLLYFFKLTFLSATKKYWLRVVWGREKEKVGRATCIFKYSSSLKKIFLLSCNFHTIQFTCFTCTIQWFLEYLQTCVTISTGVDVLVVFCFWPWGIRNLSSLTRDWTHAPWVLPAGPPGKSPKFTFLPVYSVGENCF